MFASFSAMISCASAYLAIACGAVALASLFGKHDHRDTIRPSAPVGVTAMRGSCEAAYLC